MARWRLGVALVLAASSAWAGNPQLDVARVELDKLAYPEAARALELALQSNGNDRPTMLAIYTLQGMVLATLKQPEAAARAFRCALSLDPSLKLPAHQPPRVTTPFFEAKGWVAEHGSLLLAPTPPVDRDGKIESVGVLVADSMQLVKTVRFTWLADGKAASAFARVTAGHASVTVSGSRVLWQVMALGEHDAELLGLGDDKALEAIASGAAARPPPPEPAAVVVAPPKVERPVEPPPPAAPRSTRARLWLPSVLATVVGLGITAPGAWFGVQSTADYAVFDQPERTGGDPTFTRQQALNRVAQAQDEATKANLLLSIGIGLAAVGALVLVIDLLLGDG